MNVFYEEPASNIRVSVQYNYLGTIDVYVGIKLGPGEYRQMYADDNGYMSFKDVDPLVAAAPSFRLAEDIGRALLDALQQYYQGASDVHTVRADLLHERKRVDKLMDSIIEIAQGNSLSQ